MTERLNSIISALHRITSLEDEVRNFINTGRHQVELLAAKNTWNQICSSLDVIGDTSLSIQDYIVSRFPDSVGLKYIYTYGILQSLFLQQDAVRHLSEAFDIPHTPSERLGKIREIRNSAVGHPTKQSIKKQTHYNHISRITLAKSGFTLMRASAEDDAKFIDVDLVSIVTEQLTDIETALTSLSTKLKEADRMHREQFGGNLLSDIFHASTGYLFGKVSQGIHSPSNENCSFGLSMLCSIEDMYTKFESALSERRELTDYTRYDLSEYKHAISVLKAYLSGNPKELTESDARVYHFYLREQHKHFVGIAEEIDSEYREA
ncbi:MAG: hypothetical protein JST24_02365 [Acidobacteria bacterium]|nr:hypothetical protein [Acidobacteriota bacterium]